MLVDRPRLQVLIANRDVTDRCDSLVFSATDNGGYEIATLGLPSVDRPKKGEAITIRQGLEVAWQGRVAEIADHSQHGRATKTTGGEGLRALLRDTLVQMVYVDRDLTRLGGPSNARQLAIVGAGFSLRATTVQPDTAGGVPGVYQSILSPWDTAANKGEPIAESWYDAAAGNVISRVWASINSNGNPVAGDANWTADLVSNSTDASNDEVSGNIWTGGQANNSYWTPAAARRYVSIRWFFASLAQTINVGEDFAITWRNLALYGNHGLTGRGPDPVGFYPSDIARHALSQCAGVSVGNIIDAIGFIAPHVVYRTPTAADVIIDDMAKLMGWPWGVWEPATIFGSSPRLDFRPPPTDATAIVTKAECDELDVTSRLGDLYNTCQVTYTDPAGTVGLVTVTLPSPQLAEAGIAQRTLSLDMGVGSAAAAAIFGQFALALSQISARAAGSVTLPVAVRLPGGGSKPACLLRPGADRLRVLDLVDGGPMFDLANTRRDVFRISRVETTVGKDGIPSTVAEIDSGSNLMETLQARLALGAGVVGAGGLGG